MKTIQIRSSKLLVVEGKDAEKFLVVLLQKMGLGGIQVIDFGSKDNFRRFMKALVIMPGFRTLVTSLGELLVGYVESYQHEANLVCSSYRAIPASSQVAKRSHSVKRAGVMWAGGKSDSPGGIFTLNNTGIIYNNHIQKGQSPRL